MNILKDYIYYFGLIYYNSVRKLKVDDIIYYYKIFKMILTY